jgi:2-dehydropantoate 2-reductase
MKIIVFGAGPLGSLLAARLFQGGQDVSLLARGQRLADLEQYGVVLKNWRTGDVESVEVPIVSSFFPEDTYDLVMIVMRKNSALKALPALSKNKKVKTFLFLMNNAAGPDAFVDALGKERVLMGFPGAAGYREGHTVVYITADAEQPAGIVMGEVGGGTSTRIEKLARELEKGLHIKVQIEPHMDAWSKYHVALLFPALAPAFYLCANDHMRVSRTRDAVVLAWRGMQEAFHVLKRLGYPVRPAYYKRFLIMPEPLAVTFLSKAFANPRMEVAMSKHAEVIRDEIQQLNAEFAGLIEQSGIFTPTISFLMDQFNKKAPLLPDGSRSVHVRWSEVFIPLMLFCLLVLVLVYIF